jgi:hypothetical protein
MSLLKLTEAANEKTILISGESIESCSSVQGSAFPNKAKSAIYQYRNEGESRAPIYVIETADEVHEIWKEMVEFENS